MFLFTSSEEKKLREDAKNQMEICFRSFDQRSQDKYKKAMEFLSKHIQNNKQDIIEIVVDNIKATIKDDELPPIRKYQAIRLLRDLMKIEIKNKNKALGKYVLKKIFKRLTILAAHKAGSNDQDRGRDIFKNVKRDQEKYSIMFLNELLLSIEEWGKTWPGVSEGMKKEFSEAYKELLTSGVKFPKQIVMGPQPQAYKGEDGKRNSLSAYSSVPSKQQQPMAKSEQKSQIRSTSIEQKPKRVSNNLSRGKLNEKKVKEYFNNAIPNIQQLVEIIKSMPKEIDQESLGLLKDIVKEMNVLIVEGDDFFTQMSEEEMKGDFYGSGIVLVIDYLNRVGRDLKKLDKNIAQFYKFQTKFTQQGKQLTEVLKKILKGEKSETKFQTSIISDKQKPDKKVETVQQQKVTSQNQEEPSSAKRLSVPRVSALNVYSSTSGQPNNWVIKQRSEYNSNSHRDDNEVHEKFGSFGIGGIGDKLKNESKQKEKSQFSQRASTERPQQQQKQLQGKKIQTHKQLPFSKEQNQKDNNNNKAKSKQNTFGSFKVSSNQNSKQQQQNFESQFPKSKPNKKTEQVNDFFNESGFQEQQRVEFNNNEQKSSKLEQSGNFFGDFNNQKPFDGLPKGNRNERKKRTGPTMKEMNGSEGNMFDNNMNSQIGSDSQNLSAFNKDKPSFVGDSSQNQGMSYLVNFDKPENQNRGSFGAQRDKSVSGDPFDKSFEFNKSNYSNQNKDGDVPNFWDGEPSRQYQRQNRQQNKSEQSRRDSRNMGNNESKSRIENPFANEQFSKRQSKSINPFADDENEVSRRDQSFVSKFEMNKSFSKSQRENPFSNQNQTSQNLSKTVQQVDNPFQKSQDEFKPPKPVPKFESVSQQASFRRVDVPQNNRRNTSIDNPFDNMTENKSQIYDQKQMEQMNQSWKFSVKDRQPTEGFDFDQFENISGQPRDSVNTSYFPAVRNSFNPIESRKQTVPERKRVSTEIPNQNAQQKSIHFSQFGDMNQSANDVTPKEGSKKSFGFSDFGNFQEKQSTTNNVFAEFSGFGDEKQQKAKQKFNAFELSKNSANDFFRQTQKSQRVDKPEDDKSRRSGFSGFNMNADSKSEQKSKSEVGWQDFGNFQRDKSGSNMKFEGFEKDSFEVSNRKDKRSNVFGTEIETEREEKDFLGPTRFIDKNDLKLNFSQNTSKYHSPEFNQKFDSVSPSQQKSYDMMSSLKQVQTKGNQEGQQSVKFEQFIPIEKKGYAWNPMGLRPQRDLSKIVVCSDYDLEQRKKEVEFYKRIYEQQKQLIQKAKQVYNQARKVYLQKIGKIDGIVKQKQTYKQILISLKESNQNKEEEIFLLNEKIKKVSQLKEKILEKEKLFFEKTKAIPRQEEMRNVKNRANNNKWEIFNRNLKMMRERQQDYNQANFSKTGFSYTRY